MITDINNEDGLVQKTFADHLRETLRWESVYAYNVLSAHWGMLMSGEIAV